MRRTTFASIEFVYDFDTLDEAKKFMKNNQGKGWFFMDKEPMAIGDSNDGYTLTVRKPYKNYNPGW